VPEPQPPPTASSPSPASLTLPPNPANPSNPLTPLSSQVCWRIASPITASGAIAIIDVIGDFATFAAAVGLDQLPLGRPYLRTLCNLDHALIVRWSPTHAQLMPHGGCALLAELQTRLLAAGLHQSLPDPLLSTDATLDQLITEALAQAISPAAIDLLLAQPARFDAAGLTPATTPPPTPRDRTLSRLIYPPLVLALGRPNIGKSTLLNRLAGDTVSIVADAPGTTRDYVGVHLTLDGLTLRYIDCPGLRVSDDPIEQAAIALALSLTPHADLILDVSDPTSPSPLAHPAELLAHPAFARCYPELASLPRLNIHLRADLTPAFHHPSDKLLPNAPNVALASLHLGEDVLGAQAGATPAGDLSQRPSGQGVSQLARAIRKMLVPEEVMSSSQPWRFWP